MATHDDRPSLSLLAIAEAEEISELTAGCHRGGWLVTTQTSHAVPSVANSSSPAVLLLGRHCFRPALPPLPEQPAEFDLLIAHDESVLDHPDLLSRCRSLLLGPYDDALLHEYLDALQEEPLAEPADQAMLAVKIIGRSRPLRRLLRTVASVSRYDAPIAIRGETGTGKELISRAVHYSSRRSDEPFVPVNCGALSDDLLVAELFGYERGAFTDAKRAHAGLVAQADGGTLFLDEVDSLTPKAQGALLRFLQEREYRTLGGEGVIRADVRVISATNKHLATLVAEGRFREDLFYRLQVVDLEIPPLRERGEDIEVLAEHFLHEFSRRYQEPEKRVHAITVRWMRDHSWPGNVRELENYLHRVFIMTEGSCICVPQVKGDPVPLTSGLMAAQDSEGLPSFQAEKARAIEHFERDYLHRVMALARGNVSLAARQAGKERRAFCRLLQKYGIDRLSYLHERRGQANALST
jgi:DNA-binding NtrC family response regulator